MLQDGYTVARILVIGTGGMYPTRRSVHAHVVEAGMQLA